LCGIGGIFDFSGKTEIKSGLIKMSKTLSHRGPDDEGFVLLTENQTDTFGGEDTPAQAYQSAFNYLPTSPIETADDEHFGGFVHRRLSILDLSIAGHQPMCNKEADLWITYNGEVYNYLELRNELAALGFKFYTATDTEVILQAYRAWGKECVKRFNGMWSFVIFDKQKNILFGSRDRLGVKPFYYYHKSDFFAFASEIKALANQNFVKSEINAVAAWDFFVLDQIEYEPEGFFKSIIELPASHNFILNLSTQNLSIERYYNLSPNLKFSEYSANSEKILAQELKEILTDAVAKRLRSDVPVGVCLSGGLDSSAITGIVQNLGSTRSLELFTASFKEKNIDESSWAELLTGKSGTNWNRTFPNSDELLNDLNDLIYCQDIPIWSTSTYAQFRVMRLVKEKGVKVVLSGQGGDELFGGYPDYYFSYWKELVLNNQFSQLTNELKCFEHHPSIVNFSGKKLGKDVLKKILPAQFYFSLAAAFTDELQYLNKDFLNNYKERISKLSWEEKTLNGKLLYDLDNHLLKKYLKCEDRCSMFHSVESRTPFSDDLWLIEFAMNLPSVYKIKNSHQKYILRKALKDVLPEQIVNRKDKMGYVTPNQKWIGSIKEAVRPLFDNPELKNYLNINKIQKDYNQLFSDMGGADNGRLFKFISFAVWVNLYFGKK
jgi:asparagine synthase (glutamine-hydrolysing)